MPTAFWKPSDAPENAWTRVFNPLLPGGVTTLDANTPTMFVNAEDATTILEREAGIEIVPLARDVSSVLASFTIDFNVSNPLPEGVTATYEAITIPTPGAQLVGSQLTAFFDEAVEGLYVIRRTRSDAVVEEIRFNLTVVQEAITVVGEREYARINFGADDPAGSVYPLTVIDPGPEGGPAGPLDGVTTEFTRGDLNALIGADPARVRFEVAPVIARATGSGPLAVGDEVVRTQDAAWAQPDVPPIPVTSEWVITDIVADEEVHTVIPEESGPSVIRPATPGLILRNRYLDGTSMIWSNPLDLASLAEPQPAGLAMWGSPETFLGTESTTAFTRTFLCPGAKAGNKIVFHYSGPGLVGSVSGVSTTFPVTVSTTTVNGQSTTCLHQGGAGEAQRSWLFEYVLPADANSVEIVVGLSAAHANHMLTAYVLVDAVFSTAVVTGSASTNGIITSIPTFNTLPNLYVVSNHRLLVQTTQAWTINFGNAAHFLFTPVPIATPNGRGFVATGNRPSGGSSVDLRSGGDSVNIGAQNLMQTRWTQAA
jgi:hypothetical protein